MKRNRGQSYGSDLFASSEGGKESPIAKCRYQVTTPTERTKLREFAAGYHLHAANNQPI